MICARKISVLVRCAYKPLTGAASGQQRGLCPRPTAAASIATTETGDTTTNITDTKALDPCPSLYVHHTVAAPPPGPEFETTRVRIAANAKDAPIATGQPSIASAGSGTHVHAITSSSSSSCPWLAHRSAEAYNQRYPISLSSFSNPQPCDLQPPHGIRTTRPQTPLNGTNTVDVVDAAAVEDVVHPEGYEHRHLLQDIHFAAATTPVHNGTIFQPIGEFTTAEDTNGTAVCNSNITPPIGGLSHYLSVVHGGNITSAETMPATSKFPPLQCTAAAGDAAVVAGTRLHHGCVVPDAAWPMPGCRTRYHHYTFRHYYTRATPTNTKSKPNSSQ